MKDYIFKGNLIIDGYLSDGDKSFKVSDINKEMVEISYHYLKELRDNGELNPGTFYRIIDYVTTTSQTDTKSVEHQFDIIVLALTNNSLSEEAWACKNDRDNYFENCNLGAWKLWYSLDNDTDKFAWAFDSDIKAIKIKNTNENITFIYVRNYELDENGQFAWTYLYDSDNKEIDEISDWTNLDTPDTFFTDSENVCIGDVFEVEGDETTVLDRKLPGTGVIYRMIDEFNNECPYDFKNILFTKSEKYTNTYTFSYTKDNIIKDASVLGLNIGCYGNIMKEFFMSNKQELNFNIYYSTSTTFTCFRNTFGKGCSHNTFGNTCSHNTFGNACENNTFGNYCISNTFGNTCSDNTFGNACSSNIFKNYCHSNTFGDYCEGNTFENYCSNNTFGNYCIVNTVGNSCISNTFGNSNLVIDYCQYNIIDNGCSYLYLDGNGTASFSNWLQNVHIHSGIQGTRTAYKTITVDRNLAYETNIIASGTTIIEV